MPADKIEARRHGNFVHGMKLTPEYAVWKQMRQRCSNPNNHAFQHYGGRGIAVCDRWQSFENFLADMGSRPSPKHSLERKDNLLGYSPGNVKWSTKSEQMRNTRVNHILTARGISQCLAAWAELAGIAESTIRKRCRLGWTHERAIFSPIQQQQRSN